MTTPCAADLSTLAARAVELARPLAEGEEDEGRLDLLVVQVGRQLVGIALQDVREVRPPGPVADVPRNSSALVGMVGGHGDALAVASLAVLLGLDTCLATHQQWVIVLDHPGAPVGLLADTAVDIVTTARDDLRAPADPGGLLSGLLPDGTAVLDTATLLRDPRLWLTPPDPTKEHPWHDE